MGRLLGRWAMAAIVLATFTVMAAPAPRPLRVQIGGEPSTLDPYRVIDQYGLSLVRQVAEGLYALDANGATKPALALSTSVSADGLTYRFCLRPDARWSDGRTISTQDFVLGFRHALDPKTASPDAENFFAIKNARDVYAGRAKAERLGVSSEGDELKVELAQVDPSFLMKLTLPAAAPVRSDQLKLLGKANAVLSGRYVMSGYKASQQVRLKPNPFYRDPATREVIYEILPEETTALNLLETGWLDVVTTVTPSEMGRLRSGGWLKTAPSTTVFYLSFNLGRAPFNDVEKRRAVASAVDRNGLSRVLQGAYLPLTSYLPPSVPGGDQPVAPVSVANVRAPAAVGEPLRLAYAQSAANQLIAEKVQYDLRTRLGLSVTLQPMELKSLLAKLSTEPPDIYLFGKSALYNDPMNHLNAFASEPDANFSHYVSPTYEARLQKLRVERNDSERESLAVALNRQLVSEDVVVVPLLLRQQMFAVGKDVKHFAVNPYQVLQLQQMTP